MSTDDYIVLEVELELADAYAEIARHHELIEKLRDGLRWALDSRLWFGSDFTHADKLRRLLNREVG